jgi:dienelactone hydrolase
MLLVPLPALADDAGTIAAALKDEASECRYLLMLCKERDDALNGDSPARIEKALGDRMDAAKVIRAKHDCTPHCFQDCRGLDLARFGELCPETKPAATPSTKHKKN